jgi:hypothetical protein
MVSFASTSQKHLSSCSRHPTHNSCRKHKALSLGVVQKGSGPMLYIKK